MTSNSNISKADAEASAFFNVIKRDDPPALDHYVKPIKSLSNKGFVNVITIAAIALTIPLMAVLGTIALWMLLPHLLLAIGLLWYFIRRNDKDRDVYEHILIWKDAIAVHRHNPRGPDQYWTGNPYWVKLKTRDTRTVESYLTMTGAEREIELGAFLSPAERVELKHMIEGAIKGL
ncbi:DUF2244 domain-containing protein [Amylibacter sp. SFDW26]|uniref:DUF2244 domain-containing protein n=1 Tax=Amylibacter sp. SFDW26 TaxID=2652722 RepID=UPI00186A2E86|nr:DUF2244 domain-containing protein [Amylibacter sp. SFDW26]